MEKLFRNQDIFLQVVIPQFLDHFYVSRTNIKQVLSNTPKWQIKLQISNLQGKHRYYTCFAALETQSKL